MTAPTVRILLRYGVGALAGWQVGAMLASDPDIVNVLSAALVTAGSVLTERWYRLAKRKGWAT
jgi:hypothetical protein